ncbi:MbtH family NRPS accessory protein [Streptosporangium sp. NBC_01495]|uniref:MbtH family NRPS accessory protein n=1 Tax=Streptosporangium sp. NBC_01495 TaxID=2903899 RepID=UPI002E34FB6A|nr:MbtH family NRPS accessory protein [Streptosporangium sp. NBC_01495]
MLLIEDEDPCKVVVNHEEQYSSWPQGRDNPPGWNEAGKKRNQARMPGLDRRALDRHAPVEPASLHRTGRARHRKQ